MCLCTLSELRSPLVAHQESNTEFPLISFYFRLLLRAYELCVFLFYFACTTFHYPRRWFGTVRPHLFIPLNIEFYRIHLLPSSSAIRYIWPFSTCVIMNTNGTHTHTHIHTSAYSMYSRFVYIWFKCANITHSIFRKSVPNRIEYFVCVCVNTSAAGYPFYY